MSCNALTLNHTIPTFNDLEKKKVFENIVGKGENAGYQHFLFFPQCFLSCPRQISNSESHLFCRLQMISIRPSLKFCCVVKN